MCPFFHRFVEFSGHHWDSARDEEQSDLAGRSLVMRCRPAASPLDFELAASRALVLQFSPALQCEPARMLESPKWRNVVTIYGVHNQPFLASKQWGFQA